MSRTLVPGWPQGRGPALPPRQLSADPRPGAALRRLSLSSLLAEPSLPPGFLLVGEGGCRLRARDHALELPAGALVASDGREPLRLAPTGVADVGLVAFWPDPADLLGEPRRQQRARRLLPMVHLPDSAPARLMAAAARGLDAAPASSAREREATLLRELVESQEHYAPLVDRCPGRSAASRRELFARLWRTRLLLEQLDRPPPEVPALAAVAKVSPCHYVRLFHRVFGEPPHRYGSRRRMQRARELLLATDLPIQELMWIAGHDNHASFARAFRQHFGTSASALRRGTATRAAMREAG